MDTRMKLIGIANISDGRDTIGIRVLDVDTKQVQDVPVSSLISILKSGTAMINNLGIDNGKLVGTNGAIYRLPKIVDGKLVGKSPMVVINQIGDTGYTVANYAGVVVKVGRLRAIEYAKTEGISNGKIVNKEGKEFISSIIGGYDIVD